MQICEGLAQVLEWEVEGSGVVTLESVTLASATFRVRPVEEGGTMSESPPSSVQAKPQTPPSTVFGEAPPAASSVGNGTTRSDWVSIGCFLCLTEIPPPPPRTTRLIRKRSVLSRSFPVCNPHACTLGVGGICTTSILEGAFVVDRVFASIRCGIIYPICKPN